MSTVNTTDTFNRSEVMGGPIWTAESLNSLANNPGSAAVSFVVNAFSPLYLYQTGSVNGWLCTTTGVAKIDNIGGTETFSNLYSFGYTTGARVMESSRGANGWVMIISYSTANGMKCHYTTDGGINWSVSTVSSTVDANYGNNGNIWAGGLFMSMTIPGLAFTTAFNTTTNADGYVTRDHGATWTQITTETDIPLIDPGVFPAGCIVCPVRDRPQTRAVYGGRVQGSFLVVPKLYRTVGSTTTDISISADGLTYGVQWSNGNNTNRQIVLADDDPDVAVVIGAYNDGTNGSSYRFRVFATHFLWTPGTPNWTAITDASTTRQWWGGYGVHRNLFILFGVNGSIGVLSYSSQRWHLDIRTGNVSTSDSVKGLCGL